VTVLNAAGNVAAVTTTAADGTYALGNLAAGEYTMIAAGYPPARSGSRRGSRTPTICCSAIAPDNHLISLRQCHPAATRRRLTCA
jgi:hypothetical protein